MVWQVWLGFRACRCRPTIHPTCLPGQSWATPLLTTQCLDFTRYDERRPRRLSVKVFSATNHRRDAEIAEMAQRDFQIVPRLFLSGCLTRKESSIVRGISRRTNFFLSHPHPPTSSPAQHEVSQLRASSLSNEV